MLSSRLNYQREVERVAWDGSQPASSKPQRSLQPAGAGTPRGSGSLISPGGAGLSVVTWRDICFSNHPPFPPGQLNDRLPPLLMGSVLTVLAEHTFG